MTRAAAVVVTAVLLATAPAQPPGGKGPALPVGTTAHPNLRYGPHPERNVLDLWVPKADGPVPLVLWVHGGGWSAGAKGPDNPAMSLLARGYAVAATNYRLSQHAPFPAQIEDCKAAVRFLRANAAKYALNPDRFGAWGSSAGGHLVALLGTTGGVKELEGTVGDHPAVSSRVQAVCDFYGPTDFTRMNAQAVKKGPIDHDAPGSPESKLLGGPVQQNKDKAARADPATYATADDAPFLIAHGTADPLVPPGQSEHLRDALGKAGVACELVPVPGGGHGGAGFNAPDLRAKIDRFFDAHLKPR